MKELIYYFALIGFGAAYGDSWETIEGKTWIAKKDFPTSQYVFFETGNGLKKAIFQINGSGRCAVLSLIYDVELIGDRINLKNELNLDSAAGDKPEDVRTFEALYVRNDSLIVSDDLSLEYVKIFDQAKICNWWSEKYRTDQTVPFEELKAIPIAENEIYERHALNFGPNPENCGLDNDPVLTDIEAAFLNEYLKGQARRTSFNFHNKRIVFVTGSSGSMLGSKADYFDDVKSWKREHNSRIATSFEVMSETHRREYGYDAIVTYWVKVLTPRSTRKILEQTKSKKGRVR